MSTAGVDLVDVGLVRCDDSPATWLLTVNYEPDSVDASDTMAYSDLQTLALYAGGASFAGSAASLVPGWSGYGTRVRTAIEDTFEGLGGL